MWTRYADYQQALDAISRRKLKITSHTKALAESDGTFWVDPSPKETPPPVRGRVRELRKILDQIPLQPLFNDITQTAHLLQFEDYQAFVRMATFLIRRGVSGLVWSVSRSQFWLRTGPLSSHDFPETTASIFRQITGDVWIESGYYHPFEMLLQAPADRWLLLANNRKIITRPPVFQPLVRHDSLELAESPTLPDSLSVKPVAVGLQLKKLPPQAEPSLWCFRGDPLTVLQKMGNELDASILDELEFAIGETQSGIVLLIRPYSGRRTPTLVLPDAVGMTPYARLPNLFIPVDCGVRPQIRRDLLRDTLTSAEKLSWLAPLENGSYSFESIPQSAFRPLAEWVEYNAPFSYGRHILPVRNTIFDFPLFGVIESAKKDAEKVKVKKERDPNDEEAPEQRRDIVVKKGVVPTRPPKPVPALDKLFENRNPSQARTTLAQHVQEYLNLEGALDSPERAELWPLLGLWSSLAGENTDCGIAMVNAIWFNDVPTNRQQWSLLENHQKTTRDLIAEIDLILEKATPTLDEIRKVASVLCHPETIPPKDLKKRFHDLQAFLEKYENRLPIRGAWLAWATLASSNGRDLLTATRARDRLLNAILENGLHRDRDVPSFLQSEIYGDRQTVRGHNTILHMLYRETQHLRVPGSYQEGIINLVFALGLSRLGETNEARALKTRMTWNRSEIDHVNTGYRWAIEAYGFRLEQSLERGTTEGMLSESHRKNLKELHPEARQIAERFIQASHYLEPFDTIDPFRNQRGGLGSLQGTLNDIPDQLFGQRKQKAAIEKVRQELETLHKTNAGKNARYAIIRTSFALAPRLGDSFASDAISWLTKHREADRMQGRFFDINESVEIVKLYQQAIRLAVHFNRASRVKSLVDAIMIELKPFKEELAARLLGAIDPSLFRFLTRLKFQESAGDLLRGFEATILGAGTLDDLFGKRGFNRGVYYPALLRLSAGWFVFNKEELALRLLALVRDELLEEGMSPDPRCALAADYVSALAYSPLNHAVQSFVDLLQNFDFAPGADIIRLCLRLMRVLEGMVQALVSDQFVNDDRLKKYIDEEEYLTRRRIHADMERFAKESWS